MILSTMEWLLAMMHVKYLRMRAMRKLLAIAAILSIIFYLPACTKSTKEEGGDAAAQAEAGGLEIPDAGASGNPDETQAGFLDDQLPEDTLGAVPAQDQNAQAGQPTTETPPTTADTPPPLDLSGTSPDAGLSATDSAKEETAKGEPPPKPKSAPLQKVKELPFREGDQLLNAVYITRPGDNYKKISKMIYGSEDKVKDLKKANPNIKTVKPGNKIYYNSPKRPDDELKIMNYYEETGDPSEVYIAKEGENLKTISKDLLGYPEAWKEVWATNPVESKEKLSAGTELRFWKGAAAGLTQVTSNTPPAPNLGADGGAPNSNFPPPEQMTPPPPPPVEAKMPDLPPPPPPEQMMPPPPPPVEAKMPDLPPPPPPDQMAPPPPPPMAPAVAKKQKQPPKLQEEALDQDTIMALGGAGIVAAALAALIIIRKRKQKAAEFHQPHAG